MSDTPLPETLTADLFATELRAALRSYERHVVCIEQVPEETESALHSLLDIVGMAGLVLKAYIEACGAKGKEKN